MSEEDAFLDGIAADRADRTRLLVFADWLAERSDPREEFIRLHTRILDLDGREPDFQTAEQSWARWTGGVPLMPGFLPGAPHSGQLSDRWVDAICRLFTAKEVSAASRDTFGARRDGIEEFAFGQMDHRETSGEESLTLYHAKAALFSRPFDFVAETVLRDLWDNPFRELPATAGRGRSYLPPVTHGSFWQRWRGQSAALVNPPPLPILAPDNHFLGAQYIEGDWNNWAFVAAHRDDYFALFWCTTA